MPRSSWGIAIIGFAGVLAMILMMMVVLDMSQAGTLKFVPVADKVKDRFAFDQVKVRAIPAKEGVTLRLEYDTHKYLSANAAACEDEMRQVGRFAYANCPDRDRPQRVRVERHETTGGGCFRKVHHASLELTDFPKPAPIR